MKSIYLDREESSTGVSVERAYDHTYSEYIKIYIEKYFDKFTINHWESNPDIKKLNSIPLSYSELKELYLNIGHLLGANRN